MLISVAMLSGCSRNVDDVFSPDEVVTAYQDAQYEVFCDEIDSDYPLPYWCCVKVSQGDDYVLIYFFDNHEQAQTYSEENRYNILLYLFSVIYGDPSWWFVRCYGNTAVEYKNRNLMKPFFDLANNK